MLQNIHFLFHLILQSKYRLIINLIIYTLICLFITNNQVSYCMTEGTEIPEIAEAKEQPSHQVQALKREIIDFISTQLPLLDEIDRLQTIINNQQMLIDDHDITINQQQRTICDLTIEKNRLKDTLTYKEGDIKNLTATIEGGCINKYHYVEGYKTKIAKLQKEISILEQNSRRFR